MILCFLLYSFSLSSYAGEFVLKSSAFANNSKIPSIYTCNGKNISPPLNWDNVPVNTASFVLILFASDWPEQNYYLWVLFNIPPGVRKLPLDADKNLASGILVGNNYYNETRYRGPCPPDDLEHLYVFVLFALDTTIDLPSGADFDDIVTNMRSHIIQKTLLPVYFSH